MLCSAHGGSLKEFRYEIQRRKAVSSSRFNSIIRLRPGKLPHLIGRLCVRKTFSVSPTKSISFNRSHVGCQSYETVAEIRTSERRFRRASLASISERLNAGHWQRIGNFDRVLCVQSTDRGMVWLARVKSQHRHHVASYGGVSAGARKSAAGL